MTYLRWLCVEKSRCTSLPNPSHCGAERTRKNAGKSLQSWLQTLRWYEWIAFINLCHNRRKTGIRCLPSTNHLWTCWISFNSYHLCDLSRISQGIADGTFKKATEWLLAWQIPVAFARNVHCISPWLSPRKHGSKHLKLWSHVKQAPKNHKDFVNSKQKTNNSWFPLIFSTHIKKSSALDTEKNQKKSLPTASSMRKPHHGFRRKPPKRLPQKCVSLMKCAF